MNKKILRSAIIAAGTLSAGMIALQIYHKKKVAYSHFAGYMSGYDAGYADCANCEAPKHLCRTSENSDEKQSDRYDEGWNNGYNMGYESGYDSGWDNGFDDGYESAKGK